MEAGKDSVPSDLDDSVSGDPIARQQAGVPTVVPSLTRMDMLYRDI